MLRLLTHNTNLSNSNRIQILSDRNLLLLLLLLINFSPTSAGKDTSHACSSSSCNAASAHSPPLSSNFTTPVSMPSTHSSSSKVKSSVTASSSSSSPLRPHIVMALFDDLGANDMGSFSGGTQTPKTPFMDELMASGIKLKQYYVTPICSPTRSSLFTGRYPMRMGGQHGVALTKDPTWIPKDEATLSQRFKEVGYRVVGTGKWHLGHGNFGFSPLGRGFDEFFGGYQAAQDHWEHITWIGGGDDRDGMRKSQHRGRSTGIPSAVVAQPRPAVNVIDHKHDRRLRDGTVIHEHVTSDNYTHSTDVFTREAVRMVLAHDEQKDGPLFLYLPFTAPHWPTQFYQRHADMNAAHIPHVKRQEFAGMISHLDEAILSIVESLRRKRMWHNTLLICYGDNGGDITTGASNWPYRGSKATPWEGGTRAAAFVYSPNPLIIPPPRRGTESHALLHVTDWFPTLLKMAGYPGDPSQGGKPLDGVDMWSGLVAGAYNPGVHQRKEMLYMLDTEIPDGINQPEDSLKRNAQIFMDCTALRVGDWKMIEGWPGKSDWYGEDPSLAWPVDFIYGKEVTDYNAIALSKDGKIGDGGQYEFYQAQTPKERDVSLLKKRWLFNLAEDPTETNDLQFQHPEKVKEMLARIRQLQSEQVPVFETSRVPMSSYFSKKAKTRQRPPPPPGIKVAVSPTVAHPVLDFFEPAPADVQTIMDGAPANIISFRRGADSTKGGGGESGGGIKSKM